MPTRRNPSQPDPFAVLGLSRGASAEQVRRARNLLAKQAHPDAGGSEAAMQRINAAATAALATLSAPAPATPDMSAPTMSGGRDTDRRLVRDHPSFTIEALPVEAYEALLIAASVLGQVGDDDPPYRLEVLLAEPADTLCRLDLVPDGGGSTVSLTVASETPSVSIVDVRDRFVSELNRLDWGADGPHRRLP